MTRAEEIIVLWSKGKTADQIADTTGYSRDSVFFHLRRARELGDPRAARRTYRAPSRRRKLQIQILHELRLPTEVIASMVRCTTRTVQMRLKELEKA